MQKIINQLTELVNGYTEKLDAIEDDEFSAKPAPGKWSKKEIVGHLIDSAQNNIQRFIRAQYISKPHIIYNQDAWVAAQNYQQYTRQSLIQLWALLNKHICIILSAMPQAMYNNHVNVGRDEEKLVTVQFLAEDYITHHLHHLKQIFPH
jgi:hypothetical protein